jgi:hypothetical protein
MNQPSSHSPNPRRVAAGRRNQLLRQGLSDNGRERLRASARAHRPWRHSTGPRTAEGKQQSVLNGKLRQKGSRSVRELRRDLAPLRVLLASIREQRSLLTVQMPIEF